MKKLKAAFTDNCLLAQDTAVSIRTSPNGQWTSHAELWALMLCTDLGSVFPPVELGCTDLIQTRQHQWGQSGSFTPNCFSLCRKPFSRWNRKETNTNCWHKAGSFTHFPCSHTVLFIESKATGSDLKHTKFGNRSVHILLSTWWTSTKTLLGIFWCC